MGKASRMKKERKTQGVAFNGNAPGKQAKGAASITSMSGGKAAKTFPAGTTLEQLLASGSDVFVIDSTGIHGPEASREMYWSEVNEGIRNHGVGCLSGMVELGRWMKQSLLDVKIPVIEQESGRQIHEDIFSAMFLLGKDDCFQFLLDEVRRSGGDWALLGRVFRNVVAQAQAGYVHEGTPFMTMSKAFVRFMAETFHKKNLLEKAMDDADSVMGQPFARRIAQDYLDEMEAERERQVLGAATVHVGRQVDAVSVRI